MDWQTFISGVEDFRLERRKKHQLIDILVLALCAIVSGVDDFEEIAAYGRRKESFLKSLLALPNGIPSHNTFNRVFKLMDKDAFAARLYRWSKELFSFLENKLPQFNLDGKILRGMAKAGSRKSGICLVSAWLAQQQLVLGQQTTVDAKSNEKTAIPELIKSVKVKGALVSCDAAGCQVSNAELIIKRQGAYLIAIKKDHKQAYEQLCDWMEQRKGLQVDEWVDFGSGRIEKRRCYVEHNGLLLDDLAAWPQLKSVVMVESQRQKDEKITSERRF